MQTTQADSEIEEEHLLNFVVNSLEEKLSLDLEDNVEVTTETLYEVLAGASAGGTSIGAATPARCTSHTSRASGKTWLDRVTHPNGDQVARISRA
mgnify:FL=1